MGLRLQLIPFAGLTILLLGVVAVLLAMESSLLALVVLGLATAVVCFVMASYCANTARTRSTFRQHHCYDEIRATGLRLGSAPGTPEIPWSHFTNFQVFRPMILLHAADGEVIMLPREFFATPEWSRAVAVLRASVQKRGAIPRQVKMALAAFFLVALLAIGLYLAAR